MFYIETYRFFKCHFHLYLQSIFDLKHLYGLTLILSVKLKFAKFYADVSLSQNTDFGVILCSFWPHYVIVFFLNMLLTARNVTDNILGLQSQTKLLESS